MHVRCSSGLIHSQTANLHSVRSFSQIQRPNTHSSHLRSDMCFPHTVCEISGWFVLVAFAARPDIVRNTAAAQSGPHISIQQSVSKRIFGKPLAASGASVRRALFLQSLHTRVAKRIFCIFPLPRTKLVSESDAQARTNASFCLEYACPPRLSSRCPIRAIISATMPVPLAHLL